MEGALEGISSVAFSLASFANFEFQPAADFALKLIPQLAQNNYPKPPLLSINIPPVPSSEIAGVLITRQGLRRYIEKFERRLDPRGKSYYWLEGEIIEVIEEGE